ncbi:HlyD family efflux transporter periplasmic adaptor subunit [uncultured Pseudoteredinibacter sp.]|uniref:HlyD family secretion protein n=1 Tax=uncultured Pseudoteredinibacter sp. TaxID=1641701 RepID=UPI002619D9F7|nr:HlyD family efflux transporter periplasmic adaptor subunit [uncultured Pseudoteredinibacter sp.]
MFRQEAINQQIHRLEGRVLLTHSKGLLFWISIFLGFFLVALGFLTVAEYSKKNFAQGYIVSSEVITRHTVDKPSLIEEVYVAEGQLVEKGQKLASITHNRITGDSGVSKVEAAILSIQNDLSRLSEEEHLHKESTKTELRALHLEIKTLNHELEILNTQKSLAKTKLVIAEQQLARSQLLVEKSFIRAQDLDLVREKVVSEKSQITHLAYQASLKRREIFKIENSLKRLKHDLDSRLLLLEQKRSQLKLKLQDISSEKQSYLVAKSSGRVSSLLLRKGELANPAVSVVDVRPKGSNWQAVLLLPANSSGLIAEGQPVNLRMDAFPYQQFGTLKGKLLKLDQSLSHPGEVRMELSPQTAVYRAWVSIDSQTIQYQGKEYGLRQGMLLSADVIQQRKSILAWLIGSLSEAIDRL